MTKEVDLVSYLPPFMQVYKECAAALEAENPEFTLLWKAADRILRNHFISTADEYGISRFEKLLNIFPLEAENLDIRRTRVQNRWFNVAPYTLRILTLKLAELLGGEHRFSIKTDFREAYGLLLVVYSTNDSQVEEIKYIVSVTVPENMVTDILYESAHKGCIYYGTAMSETDIIEIKQRQV